MSIFRIGNLLCTLTQEYQGSYVVQCVSFSPLQKGSTYDSEFASSALLSRLQDEDPAVVSAVLGLGEKVSHHWLVQCGAGAGGEGESHHWLVQCGAGVGGEGESSLVSAVWSWG